MTLDMKAHEVREFYYMLIPLLFFHFGYRTKILVKKVESYVKRIEALFGDN